MKCPNCGEPPLTETRLVFSSNPKHLECMNCRTSLRLSPRWRLKLILAVLVIIAIPALRVGLEHLARWSGRNALLLAIAVALAVVIPLDLLCWRFPRYRVDTEDETSDHLGS